MEERGGEVANRGLDVNINETQCNAISRYSFWNYIFTCHFTKNMFDLHMGSMLSYMFTAIQKKNIIFVMSKINYK